MMVGRGRKNNFVIASKYYITVYNRKKRWKVEGTKKVEGAGGKWVYRYMWTQGIWFF